MEYSNRLLLVSLIIISTISNNKAQVYNWHRISSSSSIGSVYVGLNYGLIYGLHYGRIITSKKATYILFIDISLPTGNKVIDDYKVKLGTSVQFLNRNNWVLSSDVSFFNQKIQQSFVKMQSIGLESGLQFGFFKEKWFLNVKISNAYSLATHLKHSEAYRENYSTAVNGWYQNSANNISLGINTGYSFKNIDITLSPGIIKTNGFKSSPLLPFFATTNLNYRF